MITIHTDGSCLGNPGPGGWAAIIKIGAKKVEIKGGESESTNNRMEIKAMVEALRWVKKNHSKPWPSIELFSDSTLLVKTLNEGWKRKTNQDLWAQLDEAREGLKVKIEWVKGHANNPMNERCDVLAVSEAGKIARAKKPPRGGEYRSTSSIVAKSASSTNSPSSSDHYLCQRCKRTSSGLLGYLKESGLIRVDCPSCKSYIKFAAPTPANLVRAKKRILLTSKEIESFQLQRKKEGTPLTDRDLKTLKGMTKQEAEQSFESAQKLF
ncbi:MAG: ribonuclease H [Candidatus Gracilibacteria bacterium]